MSDFLWNGLLEGAAQTIVGAVGTYSVTRIINKIFESNVYDGAMDLWVRGIKHQNVTEGDTIHLKGLFSPYAQLFPGDPMENAIRWNKLYDFNGKISNSEYQAMEFVTGSDATLRIGSINGETLVGLYHRYGYVGEGIIGIASTSYLRKKLPEFFLPNFYGINALVTGRLSRCPAQHAYVAQSIAQRANITIDISGYKNLWYLQIDSIKRYNKLSDSVCTLLGSPWAVSENQNDQYLVQYGYISNDVEINNCKERIFKSKGWNNAKIYFDDIDTPSDYLSFKRNFIL